MTLRRSVIEFEAVEFCGSVFNRLVDFIFRLGSVMEPRRMVWLFSGSIFVCRKVLARFFLRQFFDGVFLRAR